MTPITFTCDVEDHRPGPEAPLRFPDVTRRIVGWLGARGWRGTFFVVGEEAERHPDLIGDIVAGGHEVGLHGYRHVPLASLDPAELRAGARRGKDVLEQASGTAVAGFRAPQFSLTADVPWAHEVLTDAGFSYSSSVLPHANPLHGYPGAPAGPFRWPSGLVELPSPLIGAGRARVPIGGLYLRLLPRPVIPRVTASASLGAVPWCYSHPYDFDPGERFHVVRDANPLYSPLQWVGRRTTFRQMEALLDGRAGAPLGERAAAVSGGLAVWGPQRSPGGTGSGARSSSSSDRSSASSSARDRERSSRRDSSQL